MVTTASRSGRRVGLTALALGVLLVSACTTKEPVVQRPTARGGTLSMLLDSPVRAWDPQRISGGTESQFAVRTFLRTLTTQAPAGVGFSPGLVADLATSTGYQTDGGRTWTFTLVGDAKWQDGRSVTCEDVRYGVSRNFARDRLGGGSRYPAALLDIPTVKDATGSQVSAYAGPSSGVGQALFDRAVTCAGQEIAFHLKAVTHDFNQAVSLPAFGPYRRDQDTPSSNAFSVFSCGPYMLEGVWEPGNGGRFVRNRNWLVRDDPVRLAYPDVIEAREGITTTAAIQRIIDDQGQGRSAVTVASAPPALHAQLTGTPRLAERVTTPDDPTVHLLLPNLRSPVMANPAVRQAFAMSTNRTAFAAAYGGPTAMTPTFSAMSRNLPGRQDVNPFGVPLTGDPAAARAVLTAAGVSLPVPVRLAYPASEEADRAVDALAATWAQAGFAVTPTAVPVARPGDDIVVAPAAAAAFDVVERSWRAAWASGSTVVPELFDGRRAGAGEANGGFDDPEVDRAIDAAYAVVDDETRNRRWGEIDAMVARAGGHVALGQARSMFIHGSGVQGYQDNLLLGGQVDLATVQVPH